MRECIGATVLTLALGGILALFSVVNAFWLAAAGLAGLYAPSKRRTKFEKIGISRARLTLEAATPGIVASVSAAVFTYLFA